MTYRDLPRKLNDLPFKPFRIKLTNSTAIDVLEPSPVIVGRSSAILPIETSIDSKGFRIIENWKTIAFDHIVEFADLNAKSNGSRKHR